MTRSRMMAALVLSAAVVFLLAACSSTLSADGHSADLTGGSDTLGADVNLADVSIEMQGGTTLVRLSFVNGSRYAGVDETKLSQVPRYEVAQLEAPPRVCVSLAIGFADYPLSGTVFEESLVNGLFDCPVAGSPMRQVYLQLADSADVSVSSQGSVLTLKLEPAQRPVRSEWFVGLNALDEYENGLVPMDLGFTPTLCADYGHRILISGPLDSQDDAATLAEDVAERLSDVVPHSSLYTFQMDTDALPPYENVAVPELAASVAVMEVDGEPVTLPVILDNGRYLTTGPDGTIVYAVPYLPDAGRDTEQVVKEELWALQPNGSRVRLGADEYYDVREAVFSADGRYLGILDARPGDQVLFAYDTQTGALLNLGEEGLGNYTASFVWDPSGDVIYAMSGTNGAIQLLKYDFSAPTDVSRVSSVEERPGSESAIALANGTLYFTDQQTLTICAVDLATGARRELAPGVRLRMSSDGQYLAVLALRPVDEEEVAFDLVVLNVASGEQVATVAEGVRVEDFMFGADGTLYYTTQDYEGVSAEYPFAVMRYSVPDAAGSLLGYSRSELIETGSEPGRLYVVYYFTSGDTQKSMLPVTYLFE